MAIDESILESRTRNLVPDTIRFYRWNPSAVSIGRFQELEKQARIEDCKRQGVDIVRRITGGGAVYHDSEDEITYSVIAGKDEMNTGDIGQIYAKIYSGVSEALKTFGIHADFDQGSEKTCPNLTVNGKKISGSSQAHRKGVVLQHGTLLLRVNLERMFTFLRVPWAETCLQVINAAKERLTSVESETERRVSVNELTDTLGKGFEKALAIKLKNAQLTLIEFQLAGNLCKKKYATDSWNLRGHN